MRLEILTGMNTTITVITSNSLTEKLYQKKISRRVYCMELII